MKIENRKLQILKDHNFIIKDDGLFDINSCDIYGHSFIKFLIDYNIKYKNPFLLLNKEVENLNLNDYKIASIVLENYKILGLTKNTLEVLKKINVNETDKNGVTLGMKAALYLNLDNNELFYLLNNADYSYNKCGFDLLTIIAVKNPKFFNETFINLYKKNYNPSKENEKISLTTVVLSNFFIHKFFDKNLIKHLNYKNSQSSTFYLNNIFYNKYIEQFNSDEKFYYFLKNFQLDNNKKNISPISIFLNSLENRCVYSNIKDKKILESSLTGHIEYIIDNSDNTTINNVALAKKLFLLNKKLYIKCLKNFNDNVLKEQINFIFKNLNPSEIPVEAAKKILNFKIKNIPQNFIDEFKIKIENHILHNEIFSKDDTPLSQIKKHKI